MKESVEVEKLGEITGHGGPFFMVDASAAAAWKGEPGGDYWLLCEALAKSGSTWGTSWVVGDNVAAAWETEGGGTAEGFWREDGAIVLCQCHTITRPETAHAVVRAAARLSALAGTKIASIEVRTGVLALFWSVIGGAAIGERSRAWRTQPDSASRGCVIDESSMLIRTAPGSYRCSADLIDVPGGRVMRCIVTLE
jgi:hypothetical protein